MASKAERDEIIGRVVRLLFESGANKWSIQDKGVLMTAIKLQLNERAESPDNA